MGRCSNHGCIFREHDEHTHMTQYRPIAKGERIDEYAEKLARKVFRGKLRRNGETVITGHLKPVADSASRVFLSPYRKIAKASAWLHDQVEDFGDKFEVVNPFDAPSKRKQGRVYLNDLLEPAKKQGEAVCFIVNLLTRRLDTDYDSYFSSIFPKTLNQSQNEGTRPNTPITASARSTQHDGVANCISIYYTIAQGLKVIDFSSNSGKRDSPDIDVRKLWELYQHVKKTKDPTAFTDYLETLGFFNKNHMGPDYDHENRRIPIETRVKWITEITPKMRTKPFGPLLQKELLQELESGNHVPVGNLYFEGVLGTLYEIHEGKRILRGFENITRYVHAAERALLVDSPHQGKVFDAQALGYVFEDFLNRSFEMMGGVGQLLKGNIHLASSGLNRGTQFPIGYTSVTQSTGYTLDKAWYAEQLRIILGGTPTGIINEGMARGK